MDGSLQFRSTVSAIAYMSLLQNAPPLQELLKIAAFTHGFEETGANAKPS
jgi:hypothetical protein